jgi:hypothetical protein
VDKRVIGKGFETGTPYIVAECAHTHVEIFHGSSMLGLLKALFTHGQRLFSLQE